MKNLLKSALVAVGIMMMAALPKHNQKVGYLNFQQLALASPQSKAIQTQIDAYQKQFTETLQSMQAELQTKANDYEAKRSTMNDALRSKTEGELQDLQKRLQDQNTTAQNAVQQKYSELSKPLVDMLKAAINQVAKDKGYNYVLDTSQMELLVAPEGDDLMAAVKAKLGPAFTAAATAPAATTPKTTPAKKP